MTEHQHSTQEYPAPTKTRSTFLGWLFRMIFIGPIKLAWRLATRVEKRAGILTTLIAGALLTLSGIWLSGSFFLLPIGLPAIFLGLLLLLRALY